MAPRAALRRNACARATAADAIPAQTDDQHVTQVLCLEELEVRGGEVADPRQGVRTRVAVPAGVGRGDDSHRGSEVVGAAEGLALSL